MCSHPLEANNGDRSCAALPFILAPARPAVEVGDPDLECALIELIEPETDGDPRGTGKYKRSCLRELAMRLNERGHPVGWVTVGPLLKKRSSSLRMNARRKEVKSSPPQRDAKFAHIDDVKKNFFAAGEPVISVDTKKELIGAFNSFGQEWRCELEAVPKTSSRFGPENPSGSGVIRVLNDSGTEYCGGPEQHDY